MGLLFIRVYDGSFFVVFFSAGFLFLAAGLTAFS
jgi:hypothetical protein